VLAASPSTGSVSAAEPQELPLSIVTAIFGVPFFLWLLRRRSTDAPVNAA